MYPPTRGRTFFFGIAVAAYGSIPQHARFKAKGGRVDYIRSLQRAPSLHLHRHPPLQSPQRYFVKGAPPPPLSPSFPSPWVKTWTPPEHAHARGQPATAPTAPRAPPSTSSNRFFARMLPISFITSGGTMKLYAPVCGTPSSTTGVVRNIRSILKIPSAVAVGGSEG